MDPRERLNIPIRYNHVGYEPDAQKVFFLEPSRLAVNSDRLEDLYFRVVDASNLVDFRGSFRQGTFENDGTSEYSGEHLWSGDFSCVKDPGVYQIKVCLDEKVLFESESFEISYGWIELQLKANIKSFYFQRSGVALTPEFAGKWARPAAHFDSNIGFHKSMEREDFWDAHGGWYDAGDYGKYLVNGGVSVATLLLACELCEEKLQKLECGTFELPYSLRDEVRFELEFFLRMQDVDGGVFFKVTPEHWDGFVSPTDSDLLQKRLILGKSTTSTLNFAGCMAAAHKVYGKCDPDFAKCCLDAALKAYEWACKNPEADWPHNTEGSGGYGDSCYDDEFFWARAMLYRELNVLPVQSLLNLEELRRTLLQDMEKNTPHLGMDWRDTQNLGWIALALQDEDLELRDRSRRTLEGCAAEIMRLQKADAYGLSIRKFIWGSTGEVSNHALTLAIVNTWRETVDGQPLEVWARELLNFIYGRNPVNVSFVTGSAWSSPKNPHHRLSHSDGVKEPIPGLLVGGINADRQDLHRAAHYSSDLPGLSYTDERCSFASNETAINWNSPLTAVLALLLK